VSASQNNSEIKMLCITLVLFLTFELGADES
jgi:hypothetical protein